MIINKSHSSTKVAESSGYAESALERRRILQRRPRLRPRDVRRGLPVGRYLNASVLTVQAVPQPRLEILP